jgi:hypothetical protein
MDEVRFVAILVLACGCIPKVSMIIETRTPQGDLIERATITNSDSNGRAFTVNTTGSIVVTASADDSNGLQRLEITGGRTCNQASGGTGTATYADFAALDPNLPGQHPTSSSFTHTSPLQCTGGSVTASVNVCATNTKQSKSCTPNATFK